MTDNWNLKKKIPFNQFHYLILLIFVASLLILGMGPI